ncbi:MAG: hypothetical protein WC389_15510 [Lutibacter sp.]|jgi:hypothetical protein
MKTQPITEKERKQISEIKKINKLHLDAKYNYIINKEEICNIHIYYEYCDRLRLQRIKDLLGVK